MLKRGPFSFISYELVKDSKGVIFNAKIASFFTGFEGRKKESLFFSMFFVQTLLGKVFKIRDHTFDH